MPEGTPILAYQPRTGTGIRWGRFIAACCIMLIIPCMNVFSTLAVYFMWVGARTFDLFLLQSTFPTVVSSFAAIVAALLLITSHAPKPRGDGLSTPRIAAALLIATHALLSLSAAAVSSWRVYRLTSGAAAASSQWMLAYSQIVYFFTSALWIAILLSLCIYMKRISTRSAQPAFFILTLIAICFAACIRLLSVGLNAYVVSGIGPRPVMFQSFTTALLLAGTLLYLAYWPTMAILAWSASRREARGPVT